MPRLTIGCGVASGHGHPGITMDLNPAMNPTIVGSITDPASPLLANALYRRYFHPIIFENITGGVFATQKDCDTIVAHLSIVLAANGVVSIVTGRGSAGYLPKMRQSFRKFGFVILLERFDINGDEVTSTRLNELGVDLSAAQIDESPLMLVVQRGAGTLNKSQESPI